jgi:hypothetical protein
MEKLVSKILPLLSCFGGNLDIVEIFMLSRNVYISALHFISGQ